MTDLAERDMAIGRDLARLAHDPLGFVHYAYPWGEPGTQLEHEQLETWQVDLLGYIGQELQAGRSPVRCAIASGHGIGKSALMAMVRGWAMSTMKGCRGVVSSNTEPQLRTKTLPEFAKWHGLAINSHWFDGTFSYRYVLQPEHGDVWRFDALPWSVSRPEAFAGLHNAGRRIVVLYDEASAIEDIIWETTEGALTDADTEIIWLAFGNPTRSTGRFRECFGRFRAYWHTLHIDARTVRRTNKEQFAQWADAYGEDSDFFRVRVKGQFPRASATQFIATDLAEAAAARTAECWPADPFILGVDVARFGDDQSVIVRRKGRDARTWPPLKFRGIDTMQLAARILELWHAPRERPDAIFIDEGGVGGGVVDRCRQLGLPVTGVNFGAGSDRMVLGELGASGERYANKRAEMWGSLRAWLARAAIPNDPELVADLTGLEYGYNSDNEIQLERKEDMKKRGLASPDVADALALTFAYPVVVTHGLRAPPSGAADYDPLSPPTPPFERPYGDHDSPWRRA
jgi:hypothetical protein